MDIQSRSRSAPAEVRAVPASVRWLGMGSSPAAEARGWARWTRLKRDPWRGTAELAAIPFRAVWDNVLPPLRIGRGVTAKHGVSPVKQFTDLFSIRLRYGLRTNAYYKYRLFEAPRRPTAPDYLEHRDVVALYKFLNGRDERARSLRLGEKRSFELFCRRHGLAHVGNLAVYENGRRTDSDGGLQLPPVDLFLKRTNSYGGHGVQMLVFDKERQAWTGEDGVARTADEWNVWLENASNSIHPHVVQLRLRNHPDVADLSLGGLCTVRVMTGLRAGTGAFPLIAVYRMPVGAAVADNFDGGGLASAVDLESGALHAAVRKDVRYLVASHDVHPDTRAAITGRVLPLWREVIALAVAAHDAAAAIAVVGWDIAITDLGPMLVEANTGPCSEFAQMASGGPLGRTPLIPLLNEQMREAASRR